MRIVAFLQNMWVNNPERLRKAIAREEAKETGAGEEFRRRMMEYALFAGCLTGRRLRAVFGDLCEDIVWEETTREIADNPKTIFPAQPEHIRAVLKEFQPSIVLVFGAIAREAVTPLWTGLAADLICAPHPAARQADVMERLLEAAAKLSERMKLAFTVENYL